MRFLLALPLLALPLLAADAQEPLPDDVAAASPQGKWAIRKADLYRYLVQYYGREHAALPVLPDYEKQRFIQAEAHARGIVVTDQDVRDFLDNLDATVKQKSGGTQTLESLRKKNAMSAEDLRRRALTAILRERVARDIYCKKDPTRDKSKPITDDGMIVVAIDELYKKTPKVTDPAQLPEGVIAKIGNVEITNYEYGRELAASLPLTDVSAALEQLIEVQEVKQLLGNDDPPTSGEIAAQKAWFLNLEKNRIRHSPNAPARVTDDMVAQLLKSRGITLQMMYSNPAFLAQARARGYFRNNLSDKDVRQYYDDHRGRYGDRVEVERIFIECSSQQVKLSGLKSRSLQAGKALAQSLWVKLEEGADFSDLAHDKSDDPQSVKNNGGRLPFLIAGDNPTYHDTYEQALHLQPGEYSKPFYTRNGGFAIVKLLNRVKAPDFKTLEPRVRRDAAEESYALWRLKVVRAARRSKSLFGNK